MMPESISPVAGRDDVYIITTLDGSNTLFSRMWQSSYHSLHGAVSESKHTYLQHCLHTQLHLPSIRIFEFGFGTGLNAFLAYLLSRKLQKKIHYTGFDTCKLSEKIIHELDYPAYLAHAE